MYWCCILCVIVWWNIWCKCLWKLPQDQIWHNHIFWSGHTYILFYSLTEISHWCMVVFWCILLLWQDGGLTYFVTACYFFSVTELFHSLKKKIKIEKGSVNMLSVCNLKHFGNILCKMQNFEKYFVRMLNSYTAAKHHSFCFLFASLRRRLFCADFWIASTSLLHHLVCPATRVNICIVQWKWRSVGYGTVTAHLCAFYFWFFYHHLLLNLWPSHANYRFV